MKKIVGIIIALILFACPVTGMCESVQISDGTGGIDFDFGTEEITEALPSDTAEQLENSGITPDNSGAANITFQGVLQQLWELLKNRSVKPIRLFCSLFSVTVLCVIAQTLTQQGNLKGVFSTVGALCGAGIAAAAVGEILEETLTVLSTVANFTAVFIPIFTAIAAAMGKVTSAFAVNSSVVAATQLFSQIAANLLAPMCSVILGISAASAADPQLNLDKIGGVVRKIAVWGLTLIMTIFMSVLSVQTVVTSAADNSAIKAAKFVVAQGVPFVGGTISDAVNMVSGGLSMLKGSVGTYGIIGAAAIILPSLATLFCYRAALWFAEYSAEVFGQSQLAGLYKSCGSVMSIITAVAVCFLVLNVVAVLILLSVTGTV